MTEQIYVVTREASNSIYVNGLYSYTAPTILGFAAKYDINSAKCNKKNDEQDSWAKCGINLSTGHPTMWAWDYITQKMAWVPYHKKAPLILDNIPMSGFIVADTITRSSTSNKFWRIADPRGFQLEISTDNMLTIITDGMVDHGEIFGTYKWDFGKQGIGKAKLIKG